MGDLRNRMEQDLILRNLSPSTRRNYLLHCRKFAAHYSRSPEELGVATTFRPRLEVADIPQRVNSQLL